MAILFGRNQLPVFISFLVCGVISGILFDLLRIKRKIFPTPAVVLFIDDFSFMMCNALIVIFNAYSFNNGNLKWYEIPLMIIGFSVYRVTLSVIFIKCTFKLIELVQKAVLIILSPIKRFLHKVYLWMLNVLEYAWSNVTLYRYKRQLLSCRRILMQKGSIK